MHFKNKNLLKFLHRNIFGFKWLQMWHMAGALLLLASIGTILLTRSQPPQPQTPKPKAPTSHPKTAESDQSTDEPKPEETKADEPTAPAPTPQPTAKPAPKPPVVTPTRTAPDGWGLYDHMASGLSFFYPKDWTVIKDSDNQFIIRETGGDADNGRQIEFGFGPISTLYHDWLELNDPLWYTGPEKFTTDVGPVREFSGSFPGSIPAWGWGIALVPEDTTDWWDHNAYHYQFRSSGLKGKDGQIYAFIGRHTDGDNYNFYESESYPTLLDIFHSIQVAD